MNDARCCPPARTRPKKNVVDKRQYLEHDMVRCYWLSIGAPGTLIPEYVMVERRTGRGERRADAIILPDLYGPNGQPQELTWGCYHRRSSHPLVGQRVWIIQAKAHRFGMYLLGQGIGSPRLLTSECGDDDKPAEVKSVILCTDDDTAIAALLTGFDDISHVVMDHVRSCRGEDAIRVAWPCAILENIFLVRSAQDGGLATRL